MAEKETYKNIEEVNVIEGKGFSENDKSIIQQLDYSDKNTFLQKKMEELQQQIEELQKKQEEDQKKIEENDGRINEIDDELPDIREKIENKLADLEKRGIDIHDRDNAYVTEYDILSSLQANKWIIRDSLMEDNNAIKSSMDDDRDVIDELEKQRELLERLREQNNKERLEEAKENADMRVGSTAVHSQSNTILTFMETLFAAAEHRRLLKQMEERAQKQESQQIAKEDYKAAKVAVKENPNNYEDESPSEKLAADEKEAIIMLAHSAEGKDIIRIMSPSEAEQYADKDESVGLVDALKKEDGLSASEKLTTVVTLRHPDREALLQVLEPVAGKAVKFPQDLHDYCTTDEKKKNVTNVLFSNCSLDGVKGGNHFSQYLPQEQMEQPAEVQKENQQEESNHSEKQEESPTEVQPSPSEEVTEVEKDTTETPVQSIPYVEAEMAETKGVEGVTSSNWNVFDYIDQKFHLTKEEMRPEDIKSLEAGEPTGLYELKSGQVVRLRPQPDPITNDLSVSVEVKVDHPDYEGIQRTLGLSEADTENLKQFGVLNHPVNYQGKEGLVHRDELTNNFIFTENKYLNINKKLEEQLEVEQVRHLKEGKPVHVTNLKDDKGQSYNGWLMLDPRKNQVVPLKKQPAFYVDKDYQIQVKNNNDGARAESVKLDNDAALKSKQQHDDDGPNGQPKQVYKDYSQDESSITETTKTKSHKK